jgi:RsmE family RNA methyltransferase
VLLDLKEDDYRCKHIKKILKLNVGDSVRCGIVDIGMNDACYIIKNEDGISINLGNIKDMNKNKLSCSVDLILAVPRPLRLERLLPVISCMGVGRVLLTGGEKVEKDYFGSHLFRNPLAVKKCLIEGLEQAEVDFSLPEVHVRRDLKKFLTTEEHEMFPSSSYYKFIAHPFNADDIVPKRMKEYMKHTDNKKKIVIVVGPEGGWTTEEVHAFIRNGYNLINIGDRILRTDMAVPCLLGIAHEYIN